MLRSIGRRVLFAGAVLAVAFIAIVAWRVLNTKGVTYTWDNGGGDGLWSTCSNWTSDTCPGASDIAQFDGTVSDTPSTIDASFAGSVAGIEILSNFSETITQARSLTVGSSNFVVGGGTFLGSTDNIDVNGSFTMTDGSFTSTSGTLFIRTNFTVGSAATFTHNSGTVTFDNQGIVDVNSSLTLNNLTFNLGSSSSCQTSSDGDTLVVGGTLTLTAGNICSSLIVEAQSTVTIGSSFAGGTGTLNITAGSGSIDFTADADLPATNLSTARTINASATGIAQFDGSLTITNGGSFVGTAQDFEIRGSLSVTGVGSSFTAPSGTLTIGSLSGSGDTFTFDSDATFDANSGTVKLGRSVGITADVATSLTFNNLSVAFATSTRRLTISTGDTLIAAGTLTLTEGAIDGPGKIEAQSTISHASTFGVGTDCGTGVIEITSAISVTPSLSGTTACWPGLDLNNAGATFNGVGSGNILYFTGDVTLTQGTFNATAGTNIFYTDTSFDLGGGTFNNDSGLMWFYDGTQSLTGAATFYDLRLSGTTFSFPASTITTVSNSFIAHRFAITDTLTLNSSSAGVQATVDYNGSLTPNIFALDVQDINWDAASAIECHFLCLDSGNNTNWTFNKKIITTAISGNTTEATGTATFTVVLSHRPTANVTIGVTSSNTDEGTPNTALLTFTTGNWSTPQTVTVTGVDDSVDDGSVDYSIVLAAASSSDSEYNGQNPAGVPVTNEDNDNAAATNIEFDLAASYAEQDSTRTDIAYSLAKLQDNDFIALTQATSQDEANYDLFYDSINDSLWFGGDAANIYEYEIATDTLNSYSTGGGSNGHYVAYDSETTRNRFWMSIPDNDEVVAFNDDGTVFGTFAVNADAGAESPNLIIFTDAGDANPANDAIWVGNENSSGLPSVTKLSAVDGSPYDTNLATSTYALTSQTDASTSNQIYGITYDGVDALWVLLRDENQQDIFVKINETTGAPYNGTFANSTYDLPTDIYSTLHFPELYYDSIDDYVWLVADLYALAFDATTGSLVLTVDPGLTSGNDEYLTGMYLDTTNSIAYLVNMAGEMFRYDLTTDRFLDSYQSSIGSVDLVQDAANNFWAIGIDYFGEVDLIGADQLTKISVGVDENNYYTVLTETDASVDTSTASQLTGVTVTETLNSEAIYYSLSFDATTYRVWDGSSWRAIASNQNSVHGGTNGTWYYRDNASTWAAASTSNAQTAISQAAGAGSNNRMSGSTLGGLAQAQLEGTNGWTTSVNNVYAAATFLSTTYTNNPQVNTLSFATTGGGGGGGGGGGSSADTTSPTSISVDTGICSPSSNVSVTISGQNIAEYLIAENQEFLDASWQPFTADGEDPDSGIPYAVVPFTLSSGDGNKTLYIKVKSSVGNQSGIFSINTILDETNQCSDIVVPEEPAPEVIGCEGFPTPSLTQQQMNLYRFGISPMSGAYFPTSEINPGDYIRGESFTTVYCVTEDLHRRPYMDEISFFSHTRTFAPVKWVSDDSLTEFPLDAPMLPAEGVTLIKFESSDNVYLFEQDPQDPTFGILRWISTEELAAYVAGPNWSDYVIDLNPTLTTRFRFEAPYLTEDDLRSDTGINLGDFRKRELLNEASAETEDTNFTSQLLDEIRRAIDTATDLVTQAVQSMKGIVHRLFKK